MGLRCGDFQRSYQDLQNSVFGGRKVGGGGLLASELQTERRINDQISNMKELLFQLTPFVLYGTRQLPGEARDEKSRCCCYLSATRVKKHIVVRHTQRRRPPWRSA
jgi:hypothetical protein